MKKVSLMVVATLLSVGIFAATANLPKKEAAVKGVKSVTEIDKHHKQKEKQKTATKEKKATKHTGSKAIAKK